VRLIVAGVVLGVAVAIAGVVGCSHGDDKEDRPVTRITSPEERDRDQPIDEALMLALSQAKNFHHKARVYMTDGKLDEATGAVRAILSIRFPTAAPEAEDVRLDARALLAKLLLGQGQPEAAMTVVDEGLAAASRESFFLANLYTVRGEILQAQAAALDRSGAPADHAQAITLRQQAIVALDRSIQINTALQAALMEER
jgi:tetratricopeptide (TPR) repeat protein